MKKGRVSKLGTGGILLAAMLSLAVPLSAYAQTYYIEGGNITVNAAADGTQTVSQGSAVDVVQTSETVITRNGTSISQNQSSNNYVYINATQGATASVTINNLAINDSFVKTQGDGDVVIELDGINTISAPEPSAAIMKENNGRLTIKDDTGTSGTLTATGGSLGAGIGGGDGESASNIIISGGTVTATGSNGGAGIGGGGHGGSASNITISGGTVTAIGSNGGAGIGGGCDGDGIDIVISRGNVTATGNGGAGIGGGRSGSGTSSISISGGEVVASSVDGYYGSIGGRNAVIQISGGITTANSGINGTDITISGGKVIATGNPGCAGIGYDSDNGESLVISGPAEVLVAGGAAGVDNVSFTSPLPFSGGPAIGTGSTKYSDPSPHYEDGTYCAPDTTGLYTTGYVKMYSAGTPAGSISNNPESNLENMIYGTVPVPVVINSSDIYISDNPDDSDTSDPEGYVLFIKMVNTLIERHLKQLNDYNAAGQYDKAGALMQKGIVIDAGVWISLVKENYVLIKKATDMGVPVTVNFAYKGTNYSTTIPAYTKISPVSLCNEEGYCGFLNLIKHYGGIVRK